MNSCSSSKTLSNKTKQAFFILPKNAIIVIKDQNMCNTTETALVYLLLTSIIERIPKQDKLSSWHLWNLPPSPQVVSEATTYLGWENYVCVCVCAWGKFTHKTHKHTLPQSCSSHLLVLHNTCHCLPVHQQICTAPSRERRFITKN